MAEPNGSLKTGNGQVNGKMNGKANGKMNGHAVSRRKARKSRSLFSRMFGTATWLTTWAAIITILFRCPSSLDECDDSSPYFCKPYFQAKHAVTPHVQPYYDQYAAPYVEIAKPYYQTVDETVISPVRARAIQYGAPWAEKGQEYAVAQWKKNGEPQLALLQEQARTHYEQSVAPYVGKAGEAVGPYYTIARTSALQTYHEFILPGYEVAAPYAVQGYDASREFTTATALPAMYWAWNKTYVFLDTAVWPQLRIAYVENVEPQLVRIGERLGRYKTAAKNKTGQEKLSISSVFDAAQSSFAKPPPQSTVSSTPEETITAETEGQTEEYLHPVEAPAAAENESDKRKKAREMVTEDLAMWQDKFAAQADEGATDMEERVDEIAKRMIAEHAKTEGKDLLETLESTIKEQLDSLKLKIAALADSSDDNISESDEEVMRAIREVGLAIRGKAQAIRNWREEYEKELQTTVTTAADVHFQILDDTRGLALQQIGMKWAWADGVTYKDWAKYHELKSTLTQWTDQLKQLIVSHPTLLEAQDAAAQVEDEGMEIASEAAKELVRLKEVGHYKILAKDSTENFETEAMRLAAEAAQEAKNAAKLAAEEAEKAKETVSEELTEASSSASDYAEDVTSSVVDAAEAATEAVADAVSDASAAASEQSTAASQSASSILSEGEDAVNQAGEELSSTAMGASSAASTAVESVASGASSLAGDASSVVADASSTASESVISVASEASESASEATTSHTIADDIEEASSSLASVATEALMGGDTETIVDNATEEFVPPPEDTIEVEEDPMTEREETPPSDTPSVKPAFLGAAAQEVPDRQIILDDYVDPDAVSKYTNAAAEAYSTAVSKASDQYSSAVSVISAQIYGTPKPVHEQLFASVSGAYDNALSAASSRFNDATEAAATVVETAPTPTPGPLVDWQKAEAVAAQRLNEGRLWAELQYSSALIAMGLATPTPTAAPDKFYEQAKLNYYAGLGLAQERYSSFMSAASSAFSSITATPTPTDYAGTASSMASVAKESAASVVNAAEEAAGAAYAAATDTVASAAGAVDETIGNVIDAATEQMYIAGSAVAERWDDVIAELNGRVYGEQKQISWYENIMNEAGNSATAASAEASKQYDAVSELISELLVGKEPTYSESVISRLSAAYATAAANVGDFASDASAAASSVGDKVGSAAGAATDAVKGTVEHARDEL